MTLPQREKREREFERKEKEARELQERLEVCSDPRLLPWRVILTPPQKEKQRKLELEKKERDAKDAAKRAKEIPKPEEPKAVERTYRRDTPDGNAPYTTGNASSQCSISSDLDFIFISSGTRS